MSYRIKKSIEEYNKSEEDEIQYNSLKSEIETFRNTNNLLNDVGFSDKEVKQYTLELDLFLMIYNEALEKFNENLFEEKTMVNEISLIDMGFTYEFKLIYHDIITLRKLYSLQFESQFNSVYRTMIEKMRVIILLINDESFAKDLILNEKGHDEKQRYYKVYRNKVVINKLEKCFENRSQKTILLHERLDDVYSMLSWFVHSDLYNIIGYSLNEDKGINMSLDKNASEYFLQRIRHLTELLQYFYSEVSNTLENEWANKWIKFFEFHRFRNYD